MSSSSLLLVIGLLVLAFGAAFGALQCIAMLDTRRNKRARGFMLQDNHRVAFLFEDEVLVNATPDARNVLPADNGDETDWGRFMAIFSTRYDDLAPTLGQLAEIGTAEIFSIDKTSKIDAEWRDGLARISITDVGHDVRPARIDELSLGAMQTELETLRSIAENAHFLVWREQTGGTVSWANSAYLDLARNCDTSAPFSRWPPPRLFDTTAIRTETPPNAGRLSLRVPSEPEPRWFEVAHISLGSDTLFTAVAADQTVRAEIALRDFIQTLTKTFAHLKTGLAIFDKQRQLSLFNPALSDLTSLPIEFLTTRPTLQKVLDRLRDKKMIPEPKDYKSWRQRLHDLEEAAIEGTYEETWPLASGQTFRVVGRPHPDGALAFMFEDISAEVSLTRRYRAELETGQAVIDCLAEALCVFSPDGGLVLCNSAYATLWGVDPRTMLVRHLITEATRVWSTHCAPTPVWGDAREFVGGFGERSEWSAEVQGLDGRAIMCRFVPLAGGATLVGFSPLKHKSVDNYNDAQRRPHVRDGAMSY